MNWVFTTLIDDPMNEYYVLGCSHSILSLYAENVYATHSTDAKIIVVQNAPIKDEHIPFAIDMLCVHKVSPDRETLKNVGVIIGVDRPSTKEAIFKKFLEDYDVAQQAYINLIHPSVIISQTSEITNGTYIGPGSILAPYSKIGHSVTINRRVAIGHHTTIDDYSTLAPGSNVAGHCNIGHGVTIGLGANVIDGVQIGDNAIIGAGALVAKSIPANVLAYGVPAKVVRTI